MPSNRNRRLVIAFVIFDVLLLGAFALYKIPSPISDALHTQIRHARAEIASFGAGADLPVAPEATRISSADGMIQVFVPAGEFQMGTNEKNAQKNRPVHGVSLPAFWIDQTEVSNAMYAECVEAGACSNPGGAANPFFGKAKYDHRPVVFVSWNAADAYCRWAGRRLPTEAEWEKAARGGLERQAYPWGNDIDLSHANFLPRAHQRAGQGTRPVRSYPPNAYGVYDASGNTWDWTSDWYRPDYYTVCEGRSPGGPGTGTLRVLRGGAWTNDDVNYLRCAFRHPVPPDTYSYSIGFRVACPAQE